MDFFSMFSGIGGKKFFNGKNKEFVKMNSFNGFNLGVPVLSPKRGKKRQNGRRFKTNGEPSFTLTQQDRHGIYDGERIRLLTPVECERLQGFPDGYTEYGWDGKKLSDTQRYRLLGNAVTTNVISSIIDIWGI